MGRDQRGIVIPTGAANMHDLCWIDGVELLGGSLGRSEDQCHVCIARIGWPHNCFNPDNGIVDYHGVTVFVLLDLSVSSCTWLRQVALHIDALLVARASQALGWRSCRNLRAIGVDEW